MTKEEAIKVIEEHLDTADEAGHIFPIKFLTALDVAISALKDGWIPVNGIEDIPKSGSYWVTREYGFDTLVEKIRWSDDWRCWVDYDTDDGLTKEYASLIIAYMPYFEPKPYKKGE